jgi:hypothetical protein
MNFLDDFADEIQKNGGKTIDWVELKNVYFRDGTTSDAKRTCEDWAKKHGLHCSIDYSIESAGGGEIPRSVTFSLIRQ